MKLLEYKTLVVVLVTALTFTACDQTGADGPKPVVAEMAEDIPGNVNTLIATRSPGNKCGRKHGNQSRLYILRSEYW